MPGNEYILFDVLWLVIVEIMSWLLY